MSKTSAIVFVGIILLGLVISLVSLNKCGKRVEISDGGNPETPAKLVEAPDAEKGEAPAPEGETKAEPKPDTGSKEPAKEVSNGTGDTESKAPAGFKSPEEAMTALAEKVKNQDFEGFEKAVGPDSIPPGIRDKVKAMIEDPEAKLNEDKPFSEISKSAEAVRWSLNFVPSGTASVTEIFTDLKSTEAEGVAVKEVSLPLSLTMTEPETGETTTRGLAPGGDNASKTPNEKPDPVTVALAFSKAIVSKDFKTARALADPSTVTDERVAALMIALEEGKFELREDRPLVVTLSREDITWVLTRVQSESMASEFAVELGNIDELWKVNGLTFSKVLSALADSAGGGEVAYSPIVEDPEGGDSLVIYFEFDDAGVTPRAKQQLAIVADILSEGAERAIHINGHADALGTDQYNAQLSDGRAAAIRETLISMGVSPKQIITESFGESKPRRPNFNPDGTDNPTGRSQNRRAEVFLDF